MAESGDIPPNQTIYIQNLNEKIPKNEGEPLKKRMTAELKKALHAVFTQFGKILDIVAVRTYRLRGQAWVVFADINSATNALKSMQGFPFFDKPMRISYAKAKSDAVAKMEGSYVPADRRAEQQRRKEEDRQRAAEAHREKYERGGAPAGGGAAGAEGAAPPNKTLFVQGLPHDVTEENMSMLFNQFPGYVETRLVPAKPGIAFVEYEDESQATAAMAGLQNFKLDDEHFMAIAYAK